VLTTFIASVLSHFNNCQVFVPHAILVGTSRPFISSKTGLISSVISVSLRVMLCCFLRGGPTKFVFCFPSKDTVMFLVWEGCQPRVLKSHYNWQSVSLSVKPLLVLMTRSLCILLSVLQLTLWWQCRSVHNHNSLSLSVVFLQIHIMFLPIYVFWYTIYAQYVDELLSIQALYSK
jgi:hypothetical protein